MEDSCNSEIICEILGSGDNKTLHRGKVYYSETDQGPSDLTKLCEGLRKMKDEVNGSLTRLVEKEKGLNPSSMEGGNSGEDMDVEEEQSSESGERSKF